MDKILSTIYLKVKSETQTLTKSAIAQILVKIIFSNVKRMKLEEIIVAYKEFTKRKNVDEAAISDILSNLCKTSEIKLSQKNEYYITESRRKQINDYCESSRKRNIDILTKYFSEVHSESSVIEKWLEDITLHFFKLFSDEWISDLLKTNDAVIHSKDSIRDMIDKRTKSFKGIDKKDYDLLPKLFFDFLISKDSDVVAYLWEYGTSAFSAKLISNTTGIDTLTLDVFKDSKCLLDTNILMFIKLDASKFHKSLISLENSFKNLGIELGVLYITKEEFQHKIDYQKNITLSNLEKWGYNITSVADDDFTRSAIALHCRTIEDFCTYFENLRELPGFMNESLSIKDIDDSKLLIDAIENAQKSEAKEDELNGVFKAVTGRNKRSAALTHDVGLIAGAEYLRKEEKWFILSEEISVNNYSKKKPTIKGLPLALRIETLINVLALNHGGDSFDANDYMPLFASIIQNGFQPPKDTFKQEDLYAIYELNQQIALLPDDIKKDIVFDINAKRLKGISEEDLKVELERAITRGKIQISNDLEETKEELAQSQKEAKMQKVRGDEATRALRITIENQVKKDFRSKVIWRFVYFILGLVIVPALIFGIHHLIKNQFDENGQSTSFIVSIIANIVFDLIIAVFGSVNIKGLFIGKQKYIEEETERKLAERLNMKNE